LAGAISLAQYADAFEANDIDTDLLTQIDDQVLKEVGVSSAGHRLRLRNAIAKLAPTSIAGADATNAIAATDASSMPAERTAAQGNVLPVMFCDLVGSTALSARLDPEDMREVIGAYHRCVAAVIGRAGGFVAKFSKRRRRALLALSRDFGGSPRRPLHGTRQAFPNRRGSRRNGPDGPHGFSEPAISK
jgi:hypothetical protein